MPSRTLTGFENLTGSVSDLTKIGTYKMHKDYRYTFRTDKMMNF